jgi:hypothetical protein
MKTPTKITIEAIIAYRSWVIEPDGTLCALYNDYAWPARRPAEADVSVPDFGLHAWETPASAWQALDAICDSYPHLYVATGAVALWGDVAFDGRAYGATRAYPCALWRTFDPETNRRAFLAADRYAIDVTARPLEAGALLECERDDVQRTA